MKVSFRRLLAAGAAISAAAALAQELPTRLAYRSAFEGYRSFQEPEARSWRDANEETRALGGHMGHVKAAQPAPAARTGSPQVEKPAPLPPASVVQTPKPTGGHQGHAK